MLESPLPPAHAPPAHQYAGPRFRYIMHDLKRRIEVGEWAAGERLPSEEDLALEYAVSRMTCRRSLEDLTALGLVYRRHGSGTYVTRKPLARDHTRLNSFFDDCRAKGIDPSVQVMRRELVPASVAVAAALDVLPGESMVRIETLRRMDGVPTTVHDAQVLLRLCPWLWEAPLESLGLERQPLWLLLETRGIRVARIHERLEARPASAAVARLLEIAEDAPVLYGARITYTDDGLPVKYADCYNRGDSFSVNIVLTR